MEALEMKIWQQRWETLKSQIEDLQVATIRQVREDKSQPVFQPIPILKLPEAAECDEVGPPGDAPDNQDLEPNIGADIDPDFSDHQVAAIISLYRLLGCLKYFGQSQFDFFYNEFCGKNPHNNETTEYPQENVMMVTLDQISYDLWVISHALSQRFSLAPSINRTLNIADELCRRGLKPAADAFDLSGTRVISYLHKSPSIRVIPYANTALIGIPHTAVRVPRDFLAIPHELGHFAFWHGKIDDKILAFHLVDQIDRVDIDDEDNDTLAWLEEMFADVYGGLIAGPTLALSFQELHLQQTQTDFYKDDRDHPPPILRPYIYAKVVNKAGYKKWAELLKRNWNGFGTKKGKNNKRRKKVSEKEGETDFGNVYIRPGKGNSKNIEQVISIDPGSFDLNLPADKLLKLIIDYFSEDFLTKAKTTWWRDGLADSKNITQLQDLENLFREFDQKIDNYELDAGVSNENELIRIRCTPFSDLTDLWNSREKQQATDPDWLRIFGAGGWTTEGPESNPTGP